MRCLHFIEDFDWEKIDDLIELKNVQVHCIDKHLIHGRHKFNRGGNSYLRISQFADNESFPENGEEVISFISNYSCAFAHQFESMISSLAQYLQSSFSTEANLKILHYEGVGHLSELNQLLINITGRETICLENGQTIYCKRLIFFRPNYRPHPMEIPALNLIRAYVQGSCDTRVFPDKIALLKTTQTGKLDNAYNHSGNISQERIAPLLKKHEIVQINHAQLSCQEIISFIMNCKKLVTNWGSTSAWHIFLKEPQKCICLLPNGYKREICQIKYKNLCFNKELFENFEIVLPPITNELSDKDIENLDKYFSKNIE